LKLLSFVLHQLASYSIASVHTRWRVGIGIAGVLLRFQFLGLFITVFHRPYLLDIYNRILVSRQINAKRQSLKAFSRKWCLKNVLSGKRLSGNRLIREMSVRETSCPGIVCPGIVLSGKRLSRNPLVRETSLRETFCPGIVCPGMWLSGKRLITPWTTANPDCNHAIIWRWIGPISETVRDTHIVTMKYKQELTLALLKCVISNNLK